MTTVPNEDRDFAWAEFMRQIPSGETVNITKQDLKAAFYAGFDLTSGVGVQTTLNNALPTAAKNGLTIAQKADLYSVIFEVHARIVRRGG